MIDTSTSNIIVSRNFTAISDDDWRRTDVQYRMDGEYTLFKDNTLAVKLILKTPKQSKGYGYVPYAKFQIAEDYI